METEPDTDQGPEPQAPLLKVVTGSPSPHEVAALVAVVSALSAGAAAAAEKSRPVSEWSAHHRRLRGVHRHGPGAWRNSAR